MLSKYIFNLKFHIKKFTSSFNNPWKNERHTEWQLLDPVFVNSSLIQKDDYL